jgi:Ca2+-transporting ATPase
LFQVFNAFNARAEHGSAFNRNFLTNRWMWLSLVGVVMLQMLAVHWRPAQTVFNTTNLSAIDWGLALAVAASVLFLEEGRKAIARLCVRQSNPSRPF